jgi:hypothetical protein
VTREVILKVALPDRWLPVSVAGSLKWPGGGRPPGFAAALVSDEAQGGVAAVVTVRVADRECIPPPCGPDWVKTDVEWNGGRATRLVKVHQVKERSFALARYLQWHEDMGVQTVAEFMFGFEGPLNEYLSVFDVLAAYVVVVPQPVGT